MFCLVAETIGPVVNKNKKLRLMSATKVAKSMISPIKLFTIFAKNVRLDV